MAVTGGESWNPKDLVGKKLGRYVVTHLLGQRRLGAVLRAEDPVMGRQVAMKVLDVRLATQDKTIIQRFYQVVRAMARLKHPNIAALYDAGEQDGCYYMAQEFIDGRSLGRSMKSGDRPSVLVVLKIMAAIASALQHAHAQQIVHKNIKPRNIMIGPKGVPILMDFGIMDPPSGDPLLEPGRATGTPGYMSPEPYKGEAVDYATDIWSFGATMFQMLAGRTVYPWAEGDTPEVKIKNLQKVISDPVDLTPLEGKAPGYVIAIISRCLRKAPEERYHSADELRRALETAIDHLESAEGGETVLDLPRAGQSLLLHVECQEACLQGAYREYDIEARIGEGVFGEVYRAKEKLSGRIVALKVLKHEWLADKAAVGRFRREAALLSRLSHPNVLHVNNFGRYGATFFIDMDLLDGPTLESVLRERGVLPVDEAVAHTAAILRGLAAIHEAGIVHRDIKPANVAVIQGRTIILDFGLALSADLTRLTMSGQFLGTPQYTAPEQAAGRLATSASDVYAAGVILYEMLTGKNPHEAESVFGFLRIRAADPPTRITCHRSDLPDSVVALMDRVLAMKPEERPAAAEAARILSKM